MENLKKIASRVKTSMTVSKKIKEPATAPQNWLAIPPIGNTIEETIIDDYIRNNVVNSL